MAIKKQDLELAIKIKNESQKDLKQITENASVLVDGLENLKNMAGFSEAALDRVRKEIESLAMVSKGASGAILDISKHVSGLSVASTAGDLVQLNQGIHELVNSLKGLDLSNLSVMSEEVHNVSEALDFSKEQTIAFLDILEKLKNAESIGAAELSHTTEAFNRLAHETHKTGEAYLFANDLLNPLRENLTKINSLDKESFKNVELDKLLADLVLLNEMLPKTAKGFDEAFKTISAGNLKTTTAELDELVSKFDGSLSLDFKESSKEIKDLAKFLGVTNKEALQFLSVLETATAKDDIGIRDATIMTEEMGKMVASTNNLGNTYAFAAKRAAQLYEEQENVSQMKLGAGIDGLIVALTAGTAIYTYTIDSLDLLKKALTSLRSSFVAVSSVVADFLKGISNLPYTLGSAVGSFAEFYKKTMVYISAFRYELGAMFKRMNYDILFAILKQNFINSMKGMLQSAIDFSSALYTNFSKVASRIGNTFSIVTTTLADLGNALRFISTTIQIQLVGAFYSIVESVPKLFQLLASSVVGSFKTAQAAFSTFVTVLKSAGLSLGNTILTVGAQITQGVQVVVQSVVQMGNTLIASVKAGVQAVTSTIAAFNQGVKATVAGVVNAGKSIKGSFMGAVAKASSLLKSSLGSSLLFVVEVSALVGPALTKIGEKLNESESTIVRFIGKIALLAGAILNTFNTVVFAVLTKVGDAFIEAGEKMSESIYEAIKAFNKFDVTMNRFKFVMTGVTNEFGSDVIGSFGKWSGVLQELNKTTNYTREEIIKSMKLLILEGAQLGLGFEQNSALLKTAGDIAASTGNSLHYVTGKIISALNGEANALANLGFNVTATGLAHSKLAKTMGLTLDQMNEQEVLQLRINELLKQAKPIMGAAANELNTIEGAEAALNKVRQDTLIIMGNQIWFTKLLIKQKLYFARLINNMPEIILRFIGTLKDFGSVLLIVTGNLIKFSLYILSAVSILKIVLGWMGIAVTITGMLSTAFAILWKRVLPLIVVFSVLKEALYQLQENKAVVSFLKDLGMSLGFYSHKTEEAIEETSALSALFSGLFQAAVDIAKASMAGFIQLIYATQLAYIEFRKLFANSDDLETWAAMSEKIEMDMRSVGKTGMKSLSNTFGFLAEDTALAADGVANFSGELTQAEINLRNFKREVTQLAKKINKDFSESSERIAILGNEFDRAVANVATAQKELDTVFEYKGSREQTAERLAAAQVKLIKERIQAEKLLNDTITQLETNARNSIISQLRERNKLVEAIKLENIERLKTFDDQVAGLKRLNLLTDAQLTKLGELRKAIIAENAASISSAYEEQLKKENKALFDKYDALEKYTEGVLAQEGLLAATGEQAIEIAKARKMAELDSIESQLKGLGILTAARKAQIDEARKAASVEASIGQNNLAVEKYQELVNASRDLAKTLPTIQASELEQLNLFERQRLAQVAIAEERLRSLGILNSERQAELNAYRDLIKKETLLKKQVGYLESLKSLTDETKSINDDLFKEQLTAIDQIEYMRDLKLEELDTLEDQLRLTKALTEARKADIDRARKATEGKAAADIKKQTGGADTGTIKALQGIGMNISSLAAPMMAVIDAVQGIVGMLQKIVDAVPALFNAVAGLLNSITELPQELVRSLGNLLSSLSRFYKEFITNLIKALGDIPEMLANFLIDVPNIIGNALTKTIPEALLTLVDRMPEIVEKLAMGLIMAMPKIAMAFVQFFIIELPRIMWEITKMMPQLAIAFLNGIWEGIKELGSMLWDFFTGGDFFSGITEDIGSSLKDAWEGIANETSQLFNVKDLSEQVKGFDMADRIGAAVKSGFTSGVNFLKRAWEGFVQALKDAWMWIRTNIIDPIVNAIKNAWVWVRDEIINPMLDSIKAAWVWIRDNIINPVIEAIKIAWVWIRDKIINPVIEGIKSAWVWIRDKIVTPMTEGIKSAWLWIRDNIITPLSNFVSNMGANIKSAFANIGETFKTLGTKIWEGLKEKLSGIGDFFKNIFDSINPANLFSKIFAVDYKGKGAVETALGIDIPFLNFAQGGTVPGQALVPGDSLMNDRILALLSPGEAVVPRSVMNDPVLGQLVRAVINGDYNPPKFAYGISDLVDDITGGGSAVLDFLGIPNPWEFVKEKIFGDLIWSMLATNKFHNGGLVLPQFAMGGEVPALLQPGEFVINRQATAQNFGTLSAMNSGSFSGGLSGGIVIEKIEINARTNLDAEGVRREVIPAIEKHLLKKSQNGQRVLDPAGVRK